MHLVCTLLICIAKPTEAAAVAAATAAGPRRNMKPWGEMKVEELLQKASMVHALEVSNAYGLSP